MGAFLTFLYKASIVCAAAAHGADLGATQRCIGTGQCRELNPALARFENPAIFGAAKLGVASGGLLITHRIWEEGKERDRKSLKWAAIGANFATCSVFSGIAAGNMRRAATMTGAPYR